MFQCRTPMVCSVIFLQKYLSGGRNGRLLFGLIVFMYWLFASAGPTACKSYKQINKQRAMSLTVLVPEAFRAPLLSWNQYWLLWKRNSFILMHYSGPLCLAHLPCVKYTQYVGFLVERICVCVCVIETSDLRMGCYQCRVSFRLCSKLTGLKTALSGRSGQVEKNNSCACVSACVCVCVACNKIQRLGFKSSQLLHHSSPSQG